MPHINWIASVIVGSLMTFGSIGYGQIGSTTCSKLLQEHQLDRASGLYSLGYPTDLVECLGDEAWELSGSEATTAALNMARQALAIHEQEARWLQGYSAYSASTASHLALVTFYNALELKQQKVDGRDLLDIGLGAIEALRLGLSASTDADDLERLLQLVWYVADMQVSRRQHFQAVNLCRSIIADVTQCNVRYSDPKVMRELARLHSFIAAMAAMRFSEEPAVRSSLLGHYQNALTESYSAASLEPLDEELEEMLLVSLDGACYEQIMQFSDVGEGANQIKTLLEALETSAPQVLTPALRLAISGIRSASAYRLSDLKRAVDITSGSAGGAAPKFLSILHNQYYLSAKTWLVSMLLDVGDVEGAERELAILKQISDSTIPSDWNTSGTWEAQVLTFRHDLEVLKRNPKAYQESWELARKAHEGLLQEDRWSTVTALNLFYLHQSRILGGSKKDGAESLVQMKLLFKNYFEGDRSRTARLAQLELQLAEICVLRHSERVKAMALASRYLRQLDAVPPSDRTLEHKYLRCFAEQVAGNSAGADLAKARLKQIGIASAWYELPTSLTIGSFF